MEALRTEGLPVVSPGDTIDGYQVLAHLAAGGMASVYVARRTRAGGFEKRVAIKVMHPHLREERAFHDMFLDEAMIASRIHHPNVVSVHDVGEHKGLLYLVMELLAGRSLSQLAASHAERPVPLGTLLALLAHTAEGLHAAHETKGDDGALLGIVHRDVSPQNVFVGFDGSVKVVDFGIAKAHGRLTITETGEVKGKASYMAPEQVRGAKEVDRRADVWAFGVMAWELLTRRRLFVAPDIGARLMLVTNGPIPALEELDPTLPKDVCDAVHRCLERDLEARALELASIAGVLMSAAERLGQHRARDLADEMEARFGEARRADERRLEAAVAQGSRAAIDDAARTGDVSRDGAPTSATARSEVGPRRSAVARAENASSDGPRELTYVAAVPAAATASRERSEEPPPTVPVAEPTGRRTRGAGAAVVLSLALVAAGIAAWAAWPRAGGSAPPALPTQPPQVADVPPRAIAPSAAPAALAVPAPLPTLDEPSPPEAADSITTDAPPREPAVHVPASASRRSRAARVEALPREQDPTPDPAAARPEVSAPPSSTSPPEPAEPRSRILDSPYR